ncbi:MAG: helix-turn-helix transcriptional regulator [Coriobacteriaceae bacterium]|nr:helix-turn-helix transcriptional regulator [Coriobacteriaceae bacterium]
MAKHERRVQEPLPETENIYETPCPILIAMRIIGQKWKLPILWYIADSEEGTLRYKELERRVVGITATMLAKCLKELEADGVVRRVQRSTIPPAVEYSLTEKGLALVPALDAVYDWAGRYAR